MVLSAVEHPSVVGAAEKMSEKHSGAVAPERAMLHFGIFVDQAGQDARGNSRRVLMRANLVGVQAISPA